MLHNKHKKFYHFTKGKVKDRIGIVFGGEKDASKFHPSAKIKRWDGEVSAEVTLVHDHIKGKESYADDGKIVTWEKGNWKAKFYQRYDVNDGGFEFEVHIPERPDINQIQFKVDTMGLEWYYQPPLTQDEIDEGGTRPDNVVGSYAVYSKAPKKNIVGGKEYKTGKVFHVYRPYVVDKLGKKTWGVFSLDKRKGILTITIDNNWLDNAAYPIIIDPTFGYTSVGGSSGSSSGNRVKGSYASGSVGTGVSQSIYIRDLATRVFKQGIYTKTGLGSGTYLAETEEGVMPSSAAWVELDYTTSPALTSTDYYLFYRHETTATATYYDVLTNAGMFYTLLYSSDWDASFTGISPYDRIFSIYVTYTAGATAYTLTADKATYSATYNAATLTYTALNHYTLTAAKATYSATYRDAGLTYLRALSFTASGASFTATYNNADLLRNLKLTVSQAEFSATYNASNLLKTNLFSASGGEFTATYQDATLTYTETNDYTITASSGSFTASYNDSNLLKTTLLTATAASYSATYNDVGFSLIKVYSLTAGAATFEATYQDAELLKSNILTAENAEFTANYYAATLTYEIAGSYTIGCNTGTFESTYNSANLLKTNILNASGNTFTANYKDASIVRKATLTAEKATFTSVSYNAILLRNVQLIAEAETFNATYNDANLSKHIFYTLLAETTAFEFTAFDCGLTRRAYMAAEMAAFIGTYANVAFRRSGDKYEVLHKLSGITFLQSGDSAMTTVINNIGKITSEQNENSTITPLVNKKATITTEIIETSKLY